MHVISGPEKSLAGGIEDPALKAAGFSPGGQHGKISSRSLFSACASSACQSNQGSSGHTIAIE